MRLKKFAALFLVAAIIAGIALVFWFQHELNEPYYGSSKDQVFVQIPKGANGNTIAELLYDAKVIRFQFPFVVYLRWQDLARRMKAGEYRFASPASPKQIADRIASGDVYCISITIPEGLTAQETIDILTRHGIGDAAELEPLLRHTAWLKDIAPGISSLEGYLFPNTYRFPRTVSPVDVLKIMVEEFHARYGELRARFSVPEGWKTADIVTLASIIEKEAKTAEERLLVASVLYNRLRIKMPLACDATIIYALKQSGSFDGNLRKVHLSMNSPYNTYIHQGLPPRPIANPGASSLAAALNPARTEYLFYVSRNDGTHQFSEDYRSHLIAVERYQKSRRARSN